MKTLLSLYEVIIGEKTKLYRIWENNIIWNLGKQSCMKFEPTFD